MERIELIRRPNAIQCEWHRIFQSQRSGHCAFMFTVNRVRPSNELLFYYYL